MRRLRTLVVGVVSVFALVLAPAAFAVANQGNPQVDPNKKEDLTTAALACKRQSAANSTGQDIFLSTGDPRTYTGTSWQTVECATTTFRLGYNQRALVVADFAAETDCNGSSPTNGQWCQTRALLSGTGYPITEGAPMAPEPSSFAIDSVAGGYSNWQAHTMNRGWEIHCQYTSGCQYRFTVQTRNHDTSITGLWLDEVAAHLRISYGNPAPL
ncbi:MAG TPA: hypothetical protein VFM05_09555 [Candidatus Saccharimonadales bacterium]|nr:hypothetical protein [Candidatus Saccharimonadales bacterium]